MEPSPETYAFSELRRAALGPSTGAHDGTEPEKEAHVELCSMIKSSRSRAMLFPVATD